MAKEMNLIDRIDTVRANSVSDLEFEKTWGGEPRQEGEKINGTLGSVTDSSKNGHRK